MRSTIGRIIGAVLRQKPDAKKNDDIDVEGGREPAELIEPIVPKQPAQTLAVEPATDNTPETISSKQVILDYATFVFAKENIPRIIIAAILTGFGTALNLLLPYFLVMVMSSLSKNESEKDSVLERSQIGMISLLIFFYTLSQLIPNLRDQVLVPVTTNNTKRLLYKLAEHELTQTSLETRIKKPPEDGTRQIQRTFQVSVIGDPLLKQVAPTLMEIIIAVLALSVRYGWQVGFSMSFILAIYTVVCGKTTNSIIDAHEKAMKKGNAAWGVLQDAVASVDKYKLIHDCARVADKMQELNQTLEQNAESDRIASTLPLKIGMGNITISRLGMLAAIIFVATRVPNEFNIAELGALIGYFNQLSTASLPALSDSMNRIYSHWPDLKNVFHQLQKSSEIIDRYPDAKLDLHGAPGIQIRDLTFSYKGKEPTFKKVSLDIPSGGKKVALISQSGGGKSTLLTLLSRSYLPAHGSICIDGKDINEVGLKSLKENIAVIGQDANLFNASVRDNIKYGAINSSAVTDEQLFELAKNLNLADFICSLGRATQSHSESKELKVDFESFKRGLDVNVGEGGNKVSGGQRKKVAILRGFVKEAPIRLLDEVTAGLDADSVSTVMAGVNKMSANSTTIFITHNLKEITAVDRIIVLEKGEVIAQGTHEDLLQKCRLYRDLWGKQNLPSADPQHQSKPRL